MYSRSSRRIPSYVVVEIAFPFLRLSTSTDHFIIYSNDTYNLFRPNQKQYMVKFPGRGGSGGGGRKRLLRGSTVVIITLTLALTAAGLSLLWVTSLGDVPVVLVGYHDVIDGISRHMQQQQRPQSAEQITSNLRQGQPLSARPQPKIPHNIIFTYKHNILESERKEPEIFYNNIINTRDVYISAWNDPNARTIFLDNDGCREYISQAEPRLVEYFDKEETGMFKADICRVAVLYMIGGYYFDIDLGALEAVKLEPNCTFATVKEAVKDFNCQKGCPKDPEMLAVIQEQLWKAHEGNFFQAFLASAPGHPILRGALKYMLLHYQGKKSAQGMLGVNTLGTAYKEIEPSERGIVRILQEFENIEGKEGYYPGYQQKGEGCCCQHIVHDSKERKVYFYSRIVGSGFKCSVPMDTANKGNSETSLAKGHLVKHHR